MIALLRYAARKVGLELWLSKCKWAQVRLGDQPRAEPERTHVELVAMAPFPETETVQVLGASAHLRADY